MPLDFTCPHCQARTVVDDEFLGHEGPCFSCGKPVSIPGTPPTKSRSSAAERSRVAPGTWLSVAGVVVAGVLAAVILVSAMVGFVLPVVRSARASAQETTCRNNLARIGQALLLYHQKYGSYPPAVVTDAQGKPMHSWRVLILPQLGQESLYMQYDFNKPWDSMENAAVARHIPSVYQCPSDTSDPTLRETSILAIVGEGTVFPRGKARTQAEIVDGLANTMMMVECHESGISWTEPKDMSVSALRQGVNAPAGPGVSIRSHHEGGAFVLLADGQPLLLSEMTTKESLEALATIAGREAIPWEAIQR